MTPIKQVSVDTQMAIKRMEKMAVGETVTDADLRIAVAGDPCGAKRYCIDTARRTLLREKQMVFERVRNTGWMRMSDSKIVEFASADISRSRRIAKRGLIKLGCAQYDKLSRDEKISFNTHASVFAAIQHIGGTKQLEAVEKRVREQDKRLELSETLAAFGAK